MLAIGATARRQATGPQNGTRASRPASCSAYFSLRRIVTCLVCTAFYERPSLFPWDVRTESWERDTFGNKFGKEHGDVHLEPLEATIQSLPFPVQVVFIHLIVLEIDPDCRLSLHIHGTQEESEIRARIFKNCS